LDSLSTFVLRPSRLSSSSPLSTWWW
jgi:hypothetical protein